MVCHHTAGCSAWFASGTTLMPMNDGEELDALTPVARASATQDVAARLLDYVTRGDLGPGAKLPSERRLMEALQVGRSTIRETLAAFQVLGIVESRAGSGTYLRGSATALLPTVINWGLALGDARLRDLVEARGALEVVSAQFAATRVTPESADRLLANTALMAEVDNDPARFVDTDIDFHFLVADIAGNAVLADMLHSVRALLRVWIERAIATEHGTEETLVEHMAVAEAIRRGDAIAAAEAMRRHMTAAAERLERSLEEPLS